MAKLKGFGGGRGSGLRGFGNGRGNFGGGQTYGWPTRTRQEPGVGTDERIVTERENPQQNVKTEDGTHTFYDPATGRSGQAGPKRGS